jgi:predicted TPR repeat methyltransferase
VDYGDWASRYDADTQRFGWCAPRHVLGALPAWTPRGSDLRVLDLGVGTGQCSAPFLEVGASVVGVDASAAMLEQAAQRGAFSALVELELGTRPLEAAVGRHGPFDVVVACGVLHFVASLGALLAELRPLVQSSGVIAMTTIPPQPRGFGVKTNVVEPPTIADWLRDAGFEVEAQSSFIAYYDQADENDPVTYTLSVARRGVTHR